MRISEKLELVSSIGRELQSRYTFDEIDSFLVEFGITPPSDGNWGSKWVYSKEALRGCPEDTILRIASELGMPVGGAPASASLAPPKNWSGTKAFRLFISHLAVEKAKAKRLKDCLAPYGVAGFVAHEDIHPTLEWQSEIERALWAMDAFVAIHTPDFSKSIWCQQEVGFALGRGVKIISLRMGEDPTGFIGKHQAIARRNRPAEDIAKEISDILADDPRTSARLDEGKREISPHIEDNLPF
ncbi:toll/interleukin-1 receptor domain-containing protein [Devosia sediminis]|uniref:Toll/interleukin-1 receptor domain-containing protein n=1 Tax=Devosia sediminis TaxID=2798801 RepID=A0A934MGE3_9HYPH|nr:toll/interleukin-1 receptor domain-containing protein [Devosia sediminis]MBJ3783857.1 toll/interleukin-1 receptor domain-containing protein [Devosia sediminis]